MTLTSNFPGGSDGKDSACSAGRPGFDPSIRKIPQKGEWQPVSVFLPGKSQSTTSTKSQTGLSGQTTTKEIFFFQLPKVNEIQIQF